MLTAKYDKQNFLASLKPGICTLVILAFETKLAEKLDGIVDEVYSELKKELPAKIESKLHHVFQPDSLSEKVHLSH